MAGIMSEFRIKARVHVCSTPTIPTRPPTNSVWSSGLRGSKGPFDEGRQVEELTASTATLLPWS